MQGFTPPNTVMGRALATRACELVREVPQASASSDKVQYDLIRSAAVELPSAIRNAAKAALDRGETHYTTRPGIVPLRNAIAERASANGISVTTDDVVVTNGGVEALFIAMQTLIEEPGQIHIAGIAPRSVHDMVRFLGGEPVEIQGTADQQFLPSPDTLAAAGATTLIVQSPSPLTGAAYSRDEILEIFQFARKSGTTVVLDQSVSSDLVSTSQADPLETGDDLKLITIGSFSSEYGMGGWRIGWFTASAPHIKSMSGFKQTLSICSTAVSQYAALAALEESEDWLAERRAQFAATRKSVRAALEEAGLTVLDTEASSYLLLKADATDSDDRRLRDSILDEAGVLVDAGSDLHEKLSGFVRINVSGENSLEGAQRVANVMNGRAS